MAHNKADIEHYILTQVAAHPNDLVQTTAAHFKVSVQAIQKHVSRLIKQGRLLKTGRTRNIQYALPNDSKQQRALTSNAWVVASEAWEFPVSQTLGEQEIWDETLKTRLKEAPENIRDIAEYGFTEMVNNVKDHAEAKNLHISYKIIKSTLNIEINDNGIGIFKKLKDSLGLPTLREAILHLSKGKLTTDHTKHTGEGIFFSSRVFDEYFIFANGLMYGRLNNMADEDWLIGEEKEAHQGTRVEMHIDLKSARTRDEVFRKFTSPEDFSFSKTHVAVELGMTEGETYVSRSQAKRILSGLEKFRQIVFNFKRVQSVGQGFVDEVFRVFKNTHPNIQVTFINANDSVEFMIKRSGYASLK